MIQVSKLLNSINKLEERKLNGNVTNRLASREALVAALTNQNLVANELELA